MGLEADKSTFKLLNVLPYIGCENARFGHTGSSPKLGTEPEWTGDGFHEAVTKSPTTRIARRVDHHPIQGGWESVGLHGEMGALSGLCSVLQRVLCVLPVIVFSIEQEPLHQGFRLIQTFDPDIGLYKVIDQRFNEELVDLLIRRGYEMDLELIIGNPEMLALGIFNSANGGIRGERPREFADTLKD